MEFIYQIEREDTDQGINLIFFSVDNMKKTIKSNKLKNYEILCKGEDFESLNINSDKILLADEKKLNKNNEKIVKLLFDNKEIYDYIYSELREHSFEMYEADLLPEHRYLIDNEKELTKNQQYLPLKYISVDIETTGKDINSQEIILISIHAPDSKNQNKVYFNLEKLKKKNLIKNLKFKDFNLEICENEKDLLEKFKEDIIKIKPQVILGWNVIDFDFKMIRDRMKTHNINFSFSEFEKESKLRIINDFFRESSLNISGVLVFDVIALLKSNFIIFEDYKLDTVAKEVLGDRKIDINHDNPDENNFDDKFEAIGQLFQNNPEKLIEYNFKDSFLVSEIIEKLKLLELMCKRSILTGTPLSKVKSPIAALDIMYLKKLHKKGLVANSNFNFNQSTPIEGAYVIEPKQGFYKDIFVYDFKSLYPSIIMTFNIDPFTYDDKGEIEAPNKAKFKKEKGILPELILKLYKERDIAKSENDQIKSYALKTTMNSFYGAMASPKSRFYNKEVGGAITSFARHIIQKAKAYVEKKGFEVIYGDTDSIFVKIPDLENKDLAQKQKKAQELEKDINKYFKNWVDSEFKQKNYLIIENEKFYSKFFIASKKRYVGFDEYSSKTQFVGMEAIRGDWTVLAKNFQKELIKIIFENIDEQKIKKFILDYIQQLKEGQFDELLIYSKKITKPLAMYTKTTPPHVRAAREINNFKGRLVKYVQTKEGPKHISLINENTKYDYEHYIDKQLKGVSDDLLESLGLDFDEIINSKSQKSLNRFF